MNRRDFLTTITPLVTAAVVAAADELDLFDPQSTPIYPRIAEPAAPNITAAPAVAPMPGPVLWKPTAGKAVVIENTHMVDNPLRVKGGQLSAGVPQLILRDVLAVKCGPLVQLRNVDQVVLERVASVDAYASGTYGLGLIRLTDRIGSLRVSDFRWEGAQEAPNTSDAWSVINLWGKDADDTCSDWQIRRGVIRNARMGSGSNYLNADGISTERGHTNGIIEDIFIEGVSDAGIDCKGVGCRIRQVEVRDARQSFKLWSSGEHGRLVSRDPRFAHIISKPGATIVIERLEVSGDPTKPLVAFEDGPSHVIIKSGDWSPEQKLAKFDGAAGATLTLPDGKVVRA